MDVIYRFCLWRTSSHHDAEDATTVVFVKLLNGKAEGVDPQRLLGWLIRVADNECKMLLRKKKRRSEIGLENWKEPVDRNDHDPWISPSICAAVNGLRPTPKRVLFLKAVEGLTFKETAAVLGLSEGATKMVFYRAIKRLAKILDDGGEHEQT